MPVLFRWDDDGDVQKPAAWRYDESSQEEDSGGESSSSSSSSNLGKILQNILKHFGDQMISINLFLIYTRLPFSRV
jgi:hypothetical protein